MEPLPQFIFTNDLLRPANYDPHMRLRSCLSLAKLWNNKTFEKQSRNLSNV